MVTGFLSDVLDGPERVEHAVVVKYTPADTAEVLRNCRRLISSFFVGTGSGDGRCFIFIAYLLQTVGELKENWSSNSKTK